MKIVKLIGRIFGFLIISLMIAYTVYTMNVKLLLHEKLPMLNGYGHAVVLSGSMAPELNVNDLIIIHKESEYKENDIVTYVDTRNSLVTHRIISINGDGITTKGDANNTSDTPFEISRIKGKVVNIIPRVGIILDFIQNPFFVVAVVVVTVLLMHFSYRSASNKKDKRLASIQEEIDRLKAEINQTDDNIIKHSSSPPSDEDISKNNEASKNKS